VPGLRRAEVATLALALLASWAWTQTESPAER
jgi:hypothetical protein